MVELMTTTGEEIVNLGVQDDRSYVANAIVVHNCDLLSRENLYGLGPGVNPRRRRAPAQRISEHVVLRCDGVRPRSYGG